MTAWTLATLSVLAGAAMAALFRRFADSAAIRAEGRQIHAHLLEFWLFVDEPALVLHTWKRLLTAQARLLRALFFPILILTVPMAPLFLWLDSFYGHAPLSVGQAALVTIGMNAKLPAPQIEAPGGIRVESPPVHVGALDEVSWRVRPEAPLSGRILFRSGQQTVEKTIRAGSGSVWLCPRRSRSPLDWVRYPWEPSLPAGPIEWVEVSYPAANVAVFGLEAHWSGWFVLFSCAGAVLCQALNITSRWRVDLAGSA